MKNKIIFSILISFGISIFVILFLDSIYPEPDTVAGTDHEFYFKSFDPKKERVFVFGSSNMGQLNSTLVNEIVSKNNPSFEVYNLSISSDEPSSRVPHLERTISLKPTLVIYGITYRDFQLCGFNSEPCTENDPFLLPDVKKSIEENLPKEIQENKLNPAFTTMRIIRDGFGGSQLFAEQDKIRLPNSPFYYIDPNLHHTIIEYDEELEKQSNEMKNQGLVMDVSDNGRDVKALKFIIKSLKENNIDVILYTMPQNGPYFLDNLSVENKENFNQMIDRISSEFKIPVYDFTEKYAENKIWGDTRHVSFNPKAMIFSEDFAKIILKEIEQ